MLAPHDAWEEHNVARDQHQPYTGTWLLASKEYRQWRSQKVRHFWLHGASGSGKTILCSEVIENMRLQISTEARHGLVVFYFSFANQQTQSYNAFLKAAICQLAVDKQASAIFKTFHDRSNQASMDSKRLEQVFQSMLESFDTVTICIDALDECPEEADARSRTLLGLEGLSKTVKNVKFFMTSRLMSDIRESTSSIDALSVPVRVKETDRDIRIYVEETLAQQPRLRTLEPRTQDLIKDSITSQAGGS